MNTTHKQYRNTPPLFAGDRRTNQHLAEHVRTMWPAKNLRSEIRVSRRRHEGWTRILFIPMPRLIWEWKSVAILPRRARS